MAPPKLAKLGGFSDPSEPPKPSEEELSNFGLVLTLQKLISRKISKIPHCEKNSHLP